MKIMEIEFFKSCRIFLLFSWVMGFISNNWLNTCGIFEEIKDLCVRVVWSVLAMF